jgi:3-oxoacyl-[acyl-carrier-protein] synthase I
MSAPAERPLAILSTGMVCSVGLNAPSACAAIRAGLTNPTESRFIDSDGEWIVVHSVPLPHPWSAKLGKMAAAAAGECVAQISDEETKAIPLLLCLSERLDGPTQSRLGINIFADIEAGLQKHFAPQSAVVARGKAGVGYALAHARKLIYGGGAPSVLVVATDSLITWPTLSDYLRAERLLTPGNSNGFLPGEGAAALLVGPANDNLVVCAGVGMAVEQAPIGSETPLRADGLVSAIRGALAQAECEIHEMDLRIADLSGEQYYFKEATLAVSRLLRTRKSEFDLWHPAQYIGETGVAAVIVSMVVADTALRKSYSPGRNILTHVSADNGDRVATVLRYRGQP